MKVTLSAQYCPSCGYPFDDAKRIIQPQGHSVNPCCETCGREEAPTKATGIMSEFFKAKCSRCGAALDKLGPLCDACLLDHQHKTGVGLGTAIIYKAVVQAVESERQRCAKIARATGECVAREAKYICGVDCGCGESIAAKIMEGK